MGPVVRVYFVVIVNVIDTLNEVCPNQSDITALWSLRTVRNAHNSACIYDPTEVVVLCSLLSMMSALQFVHFVTVSSTVDRVAAPTCARVHEVLVVRS